MAKTKLNIILLREIGNQRNMYGIFYKNSFSVDDNDYLIHLFKLIQVEACKRALGTDIICIPKLRKSWIFKHNLRKNIKENIQRFLEKTDIIYQTIQQQHSAFVNYVHSFSIVTTIDTSPNIVDLTRKVLSEYNYELINDNYMLDSYGDRCSTFVLGKRVKLEKQVYSSLAINVNSCLVGTGFLFNFNGEIYCVTCMHLFESFIGKNIRIVGKLSLSGEEFELQRINELHSDTAFANEDIVILSTNFSKMPYIQIQNIFSCDDIVPPSNSEEYELFGYKLMDNARSVPNIKYIKEADSGYVQMDCSEKTVGLRDSGGSYVSSSEKRLIGMHSRKGVKDENVLFMIPIDAIIKKIKEIRKY